MTHKDWNDNKIENLLGDMPDIQDNRPESEILARLKQDERLNVPRRKKAKKWMPALVAVAALLVIGLLIPSMFGGEDTATQMDNAAESKMMKSDKSADSSAAEAEPETASLAEENMDMGAMNRSSIMAADETGGYVILPFILKM